MCDLACRYSRAEAPPAALPASQLAAPTETCTNEGSSSVTSPLSPQGAESCSDMADDHNSALPDNKVFHLLMILKLSCPVYTLLCSLWPCVHWRNGLACDVCNRQYQLSYYTRRLFRVTFQAILTVNHNVACRGQSIARLR